MLRSYRVLFILLCAQIAVHALFWKPVPVYGYDYSCGLLKSKQCAKKVRKIDEEIQRLRSINTTKNKAYAKEFQKDQKRLEKLQERDAKLKSRNQQQADEKQIRKYENALAELKKQMGIAGDALSVASAEEDRAIANTLGTSKDKRNGVTIRFVKGVSGPGNAIDCPKTQDESDIEEGRLGNTGGLFVNPGDNYWTKPCIWIDLKSNLSGNTLKAEIVHEGSHARDRLRFAESCASSAKCNQNLNFTGLREEVRAFSAEYRFWRSIGERDRHPGIASPHGIDEFLKTQPGVYPATYLEELVLPMNESTQITDSLSSVDSIQKEAVHQ